MGLGTRLAEALERVAHGSFQWSDFPDLEGDDHSLFSIKFSQHQASIDTYEKEIANLSEALEIIPDNGELLTLIDTLKSANKESQKNIDQLLREKKEKLIAEQSLKNSSPRSPSVSNARSFSPTKDSDRDSNDPHGQPVDVSERGGGREEEGRRGGGGAGAGRRGGEAEREGGSGEALEDCNADAFNSDCRDDDDANYLEGTRCRVLHKGRRGHAVWHNAIVSSATRCADNDDIKVKLYFSNPTERCMLPCQHHLHDRCSYADRCKFSHGYVTSSQHLMDYEEPDFSQLKLDSRCLALGDADSKDAGLWKFARVVDVLENSFKVTYDDDRLQAVHDKLLLQILPLDLDEDDDSSDSSENYDTTPVDVDFEITKTIDTEFAGWEKYTKGIGSKLMARMGYTTGTGLGCSKIGRVDPVPIKVLPPGKTLDYIMNKNSSEDGKTASRVLRKKNKKPTSDVFDFINHKMSKKAKALKSTLKGSITRSISFNDLKKKTDKDLRIQKFKTNEEILNANKKLNSLNNCLERNKGDEQTCCRIRRKITDLKAYVCKLETSDKCIQNHQNDLKAQNKLRIF